MYCYFNVCIQRTCSWLASNLQADPGVHQNLTKRKKIQLKYVKKTQQLLKKGHTLIKKLALKV